MNSAAVERYGYSKEEFARLHPSNIICPEALDNYLHSGTRQKLLEEGRLTFESVHIDKDGKFFPVEVSSTVLALNQEKYILSTIRDISDRKAAEKILLQANREWRLIMDEFEDVICLLDNNRCLLRANAAFYKLMRTTPEQSLGHHIAKFTHPLGKASNCPICRPQEDQRDLVMVMEADDENNPGGIPFEVRVKIISAEEGSPPRILMTLHNLKNVRQSEEALKKSEQKFRLFADYTYDWEYWLNDQGEYVYVSPSCERITGYPPDEFIANPQLLFKIVRPDYTQTVHHHFIQENHARTPQFSLDFPILTKGGEERWIEHHCVPVFDETGHYAGRRGNNRDITERKQMEAEQEKLLAAVHQTEEIIIITDAATRIQYVNPAFETITGYSADEVIGQTPRILQSGHHDDGYYQQIRKTLKNGHSWKGQLVNKKKNSTLYTEEAIISPIRDSQGNITNYVAVIKDISERLEHEQQLRQKHKMEAVGYMAGGMAHNFNNNLSIILGNLELIKMRQGPDSKIIPLVNNAKIAVNRSRDLIHGIITYSRQGQQEKTSVQLTEIIDETMTLLRSTLPTTVRLNRDYSPEVMTCSISADPSQIQEVLINLCNNAVHAMEEKGELKISLEVVELNKHEIPEQYDCPPGSYVKLSVKDAGCGIPENLQDKIFDPFFTTKSLHEGTGMGLATVQGIVAQHDGIIKVHSILNQGTTFELYFPVALNLKVTTSRAEDSNALPKGTETILFVDDDEMLANLGTQILTEMGYRVITTTDGREALRLFTADSDKIDLLITDQTMPELTGQELIKELKSLRPDIPIILCTGFSNRINAQQAKTQGVDAFLMKPLSIPEFLTTVRRLLDEKTAEL
ncbi:MAG: PAS domain S-box protein [Desulfuromonadales bacterium]|nr:PAS domain S-box protein [Desulfuromonadales bacterium]